MKVMSANMAKTKRYLTPNEVADLLMVSPVTVRQWAQKGLLKALNTPGGHRRFTWREVESFAKQRGLTLLPPQHDSLRILVVDDDLQLRGYFKELLTNIAENVVIEVAENGFEAGRLVQSFHPDFVLLDLMMPGINGFSVCQQLKEDPRTRSIKIIAMTGYYTQENVDRIKSAGAEDCLQKPIDQEKLLAALGLSINT